MFLVGERCVVLFDLLPSRVPATEDAAVAFVVNEVGRLNDRRMSLAAWRS